MVLPDSRRVPRVPRYSGAARRFDRFGYGPVTLFGAPFQELHLQSTLPRRGPTTPVYMYTGLGSSLFARRYWGNRVFFLFPGYLDVSVPQVLPPPDYEFIRGSLGFPRGVAPFGNLRVKACLQLTEAYRS